MTDVALTGTGVGGGPPPSGTECHPVAPLWQCDPIYSGAYHTTGYWSGFVTEHINSPTDTLKTAHLDGCGPGTRFNEGGWHYGSTYGYRCIGFLESGFGRRGGWFSKFRFHTADMMNWGGGQHLQNIKSHPQSSIRDPEYPTSRWDINQPRDAQIHSPTIRVLIRWQNGPLSDGSGDPAEHPYGSQGPRFAVPQWGIDPTDWVWFFFRWKHRTLSDREEVDLWFNNSSNGSDSYSNGDPPTFTYKMALGAPPIGNIWQCGHIERTPTNPMSNANFKVYYDDWGPISRPA